MPKIRPSSAQVRAWDGFLQRTRAACLPLEGFQRGSNFRGLRMRMVKALRSNDTSKNRCLKITEKSKVSVPSLRWLDLDEEDEEDILEAHNLGDLLQVLSDLPVRQRKKQQCREKANAATSSEEVVNNAGEDQAVPVQCPTPSEHGDATQHVPAFSKHSRDEDVTSDETAKRRRLVSSEFSQAKLDAPGRNEREEGQTADAPSDREVGAEANTMSVSPTANEMPRSAEDLATSAEFTDQERTERHHTLPQSALDKGLRVHHNQEPPAKADDNHGTDIKKGKGNEKAHAPEIRQALESGPVEDPNRSTTTVVTSLGATASVSAPTRRQSHGHSTCVTLEDIMKKISNITPGSWELNKAQILEDLGKVEPKSIFPWSSTGGIEDVAGVHEAEQFDSAFSLLSERIRTIPAQNLEGYRRQLRGRVRTMSAMNVTQRLSEVCRVIFLQEELEAAPSLDWDRLEDAVTVCAFVAEITGAVGEEEVSSRVDMWAAGRNRDIAWLKRIFAAQQRHLGLGTFDAAGLAT